MSQRAHLKWPPRVKAPMSEGGPGRRVTTKQLTPGGKAMRKAMGGKPQCRTHGALCKVPRRKLKLTSRGMSCLGI